MAIIFKAFQNSYRVASLRQYQKIYPPKCGGCQSACAYAVTNFNLYFYETLRMAALGKPLPPESRNGLVLRAEQPKDRARSF